jgi:hypothetical protein
MVDGRRQPGPEGGAAPAGGAVDGAGWAAGPGLASTRLGEPERGEALDRPVDELSVHGPDVAERCARVELGRDVVAVAGVVDEDPEDHPLVERQRRPAFHRCEVATARRSRADC